jgi:fatty acid desaturase
VTWTILRQWLVIVATFVACTVAADRLLPLALQKADLQVAAASALGLLFVFAAGAFVMACKQHALGVIMHDATHYRLLNTKRFNDGVSDFFCAFPIGMVTASYRRGHLPHHAFTNKPLDPYWARLSQDEGYHFPMKRERLARLLVKDVLGLNFRTWWPILRAWTGWAFIFRDPEKFLSAKDRRRFTSFWAVALIGAVASGRISCCSGSCRCSR